MARPMQSTGSIPSLAEVQGDLEKAVAGTGKRVRISSLSADRNAMLVTIDRPDSPGAIYYYNARGYRCSGSR
jgi:hypothetical protein